MSILFAVLLILFGFILIMADILFIPGGIVGIVGGLFILSAIVAAYKTLGQETAFLLGGGSVILAGILAYLSVKFRVWRSFVRSDDEKKSGGFSSFKQPLEEQIGKTGVVLTNCRPAGTIQVDNVKYDAVSESGFIAKGSLVNIIDISAGQLKIRQKKES